MRRAFRRSPCGSAWCVERVQRTLEYQGRSRNFELSSGLSPGGRLFMSTPSHLFRTERSFFPWYEYLLFLSAALTTSLLIVFLEPLLLIVLIAVGAILASCAILLGSLRTWPYLYVAAVVAIPPFYPTVLGGNTPVYVSNVFFLAGCLVVLVRYRDFQPRLDPIAKAGAIFLGALALSLPFGFWISGTPEGSDSCLRFFLLLQPFFAYYWIGGLKPGGHKDSLPFLVKFLLGLGAVAAIYGIIDFYSPIPIPHPFADQYIYLGGRMIRRAQGMLYEASSFGNLSAFFLSLTLVLLVSLWKELSITSKGTLYLMAGVFTTALFLSYSRGSWANLFVTVTVFLILQQKHPLRLAAATILVVAGFVFVVYQISPLVVLNFFDWRMGSLLEFWSDPNLATSGRWENWSRLVTFFADHPWYLIFGIGYKTLPHTSLFGKALIADNGFMSLTFEAGVFGLAALLRLNRAVFGSMYKASLQEGSRRGICAGFMFAFWCGEMVQMMTGDIFTYWRNMVVFFAVMAVVQEAREESVGKA